MVVDAKSAAPETASYWSVDAWRHTRARWHQFRNKLLPSAHARRGATIGAWLAVFAFAIFLGSIKTGLDLPANLLVAILVPALVLSLFLLLFGLLASVNRVLSSYIGLTGPALLLVMLLLAKLAFWEPGATLILGGGTLFLAATFGGALATVLSPDFRRAARSQKALTVFILVASTVTGVALISWLGSRGANPELTTLQLAPTARAVPPLSAPDPSRPGPFAVQSIDYGAGVNKQRPEFGARRGLLSRTVDARPFVHGLSDLQSALRSSYWGFGPEAFPLNGRVWFPEGAGPFPLFLIAHGNADMSVPSDLGYEYLGRHLASWGYIVVSVDENFLNDSLFGEVPGDYETRGWLLLEHIKLWRDWNAAGNSRFHGKVDLDNIALAGHSRGGEAIVHALAFNRMRRYPDDPSIPLNYGFAIKALIAIAPSDGHYRPTGRPAPLSNISYLILQGGYDADGRIFIGDRQFNRVQPTSAGQIKTSVYPYRANHGQFNTMWGDNDWTPPSSWMLNRSPIMSGEDQRRIALVYITSFLQYTLKGEESYRALFRDERAGQAWLPRDLYITRYQDSRFHLITDFDDDADVNSTTAAGGSISASGFTTWRELDPGFREPGVLREKNSVLLAWRHQSTPATFAVALPARFSSDTELNSSSALVLDIAAGVEDTARAPAPIDLTIELVDHHGVTSRLALSEFRHLLPPLIARFSKDHITDWLSPLPASEPVFQTFELPLSAFTRTEPQFRPDSLAIARLVFDRTASGVVLLDRVGVSVLDP